MPARRVIPCLDVKDGRVVKGVQFRDHRVVGEGDQQAQGLVGDAVLRVVEEEARGLAGEPLCPARIGGEQVAKVHFAHGGGVGLERQPRGRVSER